MIKQLLIYTESKVCEKQKKTGKHLYLFFVCIMIAPMLICGCSHFNEGSQAKTTFKEANDSFQPGELQGLSGQISADY